MSSEQTQLLSEQFSPECGGALHQCGQSVVRRELLSAGILHADETTLMVLREPGRKAQQKSCVWVYRTSGAAQHPVVQEVYRYAEKPAQ